MVLVGQLGRELLGLDNARVELDQVRFRPTADVVGAVLISRKRPFFPSDNLRPKLKIFAPLSCPLKRWRFLAALIRGIS